MRLPRIFRTTSFRLTLLYAAVFCVSVMALFGAMFWFGTGYVADEIDHTVNVEIAEVHDAADTPSLESLTRAVGFYAQRAPAGVFYYLQDKDGRVLAGNVPRLPPREGVLTWSPRESRTLFPHTIHGVRGRGTRTVDGAYMFYGVDSSKLNEMREMIARAFIWGLLATVILALGGGTVVSLSLLRHVETISETSRGIIAGDLSRRLPMRGSDDEFDHLIASLNAMLERIESLMDGLRQVSTDIAHDLRTPLARLRQRLELARWRTATVAEFHEALDGSIQDVDAILETFAALLRIAQIEAHTKATEFAALDLSRMLADMLETYQSVAEENLQRLTGDIAPGLSVVGDRELLPQLVSNLVENAIRHCPAGSGISLEARRGAQGIEVAVADDGPGIPAEMRAKVFQRFFRLERSRTTEGTGLGLSLVAAIAALHRARVELSDNRPGLRVCIVFPPT
ncbi:MAG: HAMP domain-containing protein [Alphaproteobacteria bacterium]|nr:HAMP domain-containing protein [Alphaproteobacteria bacterium]